MENSTEPAHPGIVQEVFADDLQNVVVEVASQQQDPLERSGIGWVGPNQTDDLLGGLLPISLKVPDNRFDLFRAASSTAFLAAASSLDTALTLASNSCFNAVIRSASGLSIPAPSAPAVGLSLDRPSRASKVTSKITVAMQCRLSMKFPICTFSLGRPENRFRSHAPNLRKAKSHAMEIGAYPTILHT